jgi:uncharacterized protein YegJ (DUF2314 family)
MSLRLPWFLVAICLFAPMPSRGDSFQNEVYVAPDDADMSAAIKIARASLPKFWTVLGGPKNGERLFSLKVAMPTPRGREVNDFVWLASVEKVGGKIFGRAANDGGVWRSVHTGEPGQRIEIAPGKIVDWMYVRGGKIVGNYTARALLKSMSPADAALLRSKLADPSEE